MGTIDKSAYIAKTAELIGDVTIGPESSVWNGAVLRADQSTISLGTASNIQDNAVLHVDPQYPITLKDHVSIGHGAIVHGCTIASNCIIGMGSIILNGAHIGRDCIIAAGTVVKENQTIPAGSLVAGVPGRIIRPLTPADKEKIRANALEYVKLSKQASQSSPE